MAKPYSVTIQNGSGKANVVNGDYSVSVTSTGYDASTISPSSVTINDTASSYAFKVGATGTLTLHVSEDGTSTGAAITGAKFKRCDSEGNEYGNEITTDITGVAIFANVPYAASDAPTIYYKQISSDGDHNFDSTLKSITLETETKTQEIINAPASEKTITLTDLNYEGLPIAAATMELN